MCSYSERFGSQQMLTRGAQVLLPPSPIYLYYFKYSYLQTAWPLSRQKGASDLLPARLRTPPLLEAQQTFLALISMQRWHGGFCSE